MRLEKQLERRRDIEKAAYELLAEKGYRATSMLAIAKRAGASNETLYKWYGSKQDLFRALVEDNAREVSELLPISIKEDMGPITLLRKVAPILLHLLVSERAITLNRAAVADATETGLLGRTLAQSGRDAVVPLIADLFDRCRASGALEFSSRQEIVDCFLGLLVGDLQIRRALGVIAELDDDEVHHRSTRAVAMILTLFGRDAAAS